MVAGRRPFSIRSGTTQATIPISRWTGLERTQGAMTPDYASIIKDILLASPVWGPVIVFVSIVGYFAMRMLTTVSKSHDMVVGRLTNGIVSAMDRQSLTLDKLTDATNAQTLALTRVFDKLDR